MPNILSALGRGFTSPFPRRIRPEDLIMDRNGITGQELREDVIPAAIEQSIDPNDPSLAPSGMPSGMPSQRSQSLPSVLPPTPNIDDPFVRKLAMDAQNTPQLPKAPSGWRSALASIAGATRGGAAFVPLIAYGPKGLNQINEYQRYENELPRKIQLGNMVTNQHNSEVNERIRQDNNTFNNEAKTQAELDRFTSPGVGGDWRSLNPLTTSSAGQDTTIESAPMGLGQMTPPVGNRTPTTLMPKATRELPPDIRNQFNPTGVSELPPPIQLDPMRLAGAQTTMAGKEGVRPGYRDVPTPKTELGQGRQRIQPSAAQLKTETAQAAADVTQAGWQPLSSQMVAAVPQLGLTAGTKVDPQTYNNIVDAITAKTKNPNLHFDSVDDDISGNRTITGFDSMTGAKMSQIVLPGVARKRPSASQVNVYTPTPQATDATGQKRQETIDDVPADVRAEVQKVINYDYELPPAGRNNARNQKIRDWVARVDPTYDVKMFGSRKKTTNDFGPSGKKGIEITSTDIGLKHLDSVREAGELLKSNDIQAINAIANFLGVQTGSSAPVVYDAIVEMVAPEIVKAIVGSGATGGVTDRQEMKRILSRNNSPEQREGSIGAQAKLLAARYSSNAEAYEQEMGGRKLSTQRKLSAEAQRLLERYGNTADTSGKIKVIRKSDSKPGTIDAKDWNPDKYTRQ